MTPEKKAREKSEERPVASEGDTLRSRLAEEALRESEARLRLSVKAANVGLWDWDLESQTVHYSPEWKMQLGYRDEKISSDFDEWKCRVHPDDLDPALGKVAAYLENPLHRYEIETRLRHRDGSYRWIYSQADFLRDDAGKPVRMLGCHIDITDRKLAEEALRESEARYRRIVDTAEEGIWMIDARQKTSFVNPKMARMFGYTVEEMMGRELHDFMDGEGRVIAEGNVSRRKQGIAEQHDFKFRRKDGSALWALLSTIRFTVQTEFTQVRWR